MTDPPILVVQRLAPWLSQYEEGLHPTSPRLSWLPESIDHPPLFHATLLCAAVHLDRVQSRANPQVAIWFKAETLRLLNESLSNTCEGASDRAIIVALILLYFNVRPCNFRTSLGILLLLIGIYLIGGRRRPCRVRDSFEWYQSDVEGQRWNQGNRTERNSEKLASNLSRSLE